MRLLEGFALLRALHEPDVCTLDHLHEFGHPKHIDELSVAACASCNSWRGGEHAKTCARPAPDELYRLNAGRMAWV